jgi:hypothetical protein
MKFFKIIVCYLFFVLNSSISFAEDLSIGFYQVPQDFNILETNHPLAKILKAGLCKNSISIDNTNNDFSYELNLFSKINFQDLFWEFSIPNDLRFADGYKVTTTDFIWSLNRCQKLNQISNVKSISKDFNDQFKFLIHFNSEPDSKSTITEIASCPILRKETAEIFGEDLGFGSNLVCLGDYKLSVFKKNIEYQLSKIVKSEKSANSVLLKEVINDEEGLRLLRSGKLLLYFNQNEEILEKVNADTTLKSGECLGFKWVARHDLNFSCEASFDLLKIHTEPS